MTDTGINSDVLQLSTCDLIAQDTFYNRLQTGPETANRVCGQPKCPAEPIISPGFPAGHGDMSLLVFLEERWIW